MVQTTAAGGVSWEVVEEQAGTSAPKEKKKKKQMVVKVPKWCGKWVVGMDDFKEGVVGAKSKNIAGDPCQIATQTTYASPSHCEYSTRLFSRYRHQKLSSVWMSLISRTSTIAKRPGRESASGKHHGPCSAYTLPYAS